MKTGNIHRKPWRLKEPTPRQSRNCLDLQLFSFSFVKNGKDSKSRKRQYVLSVFYVVTLIVAISANCLDAETYIYPKICDTCLNVN